MSELKLTKPVDRFTITHSEDAIFGCVAAAAKVPHGHLVRASDYARMVAEKDRRIQDLLAASNRLLGEARSARAELKALRNE